MVISLHEARVEWYLITIGNTHKGHTWLNSAGFLKQCLYGKEIL